MRYKVLTLALLLASSTAWSANYVVDQKYKKFDKKMIRVKLGDTIEFKNSEKDITHNVYSLTPGNSFELKTQKPGTSTPVTVTAPAHKVGEMDVECAIHPTMKLKVYIEK